MTPKLYKAAEVCDLAQVQLYVLRSWEKEFPGIGVQKSADSGRLYRQSDVEHVLRIKQLVFGEGLTVAGARRRLDESKPETAGVSQAEAEEMFEVLGADARTKIASVRDGLRSILSLLGEEAGAYRLQPAQPKPASRPRALARVPQPAVSKRTAPPRAASSKVGSRAAAKPSSSARSAAKLTAGKGGASKKSSSAKRRRASA